MSKFREGDLVQYGNGSQGWVESRRPEREDEVWVNWGDGLSSVISVDDLTLVEAPDAINPSHYQFPNGVQVIDVTENLPFLEGNVIKYVARHREKNGLEDLHKAKWYLDRLIERESA